MGDNQLSKAGGREEREALKRGKGQFSGGVTVLQGVKEDRHWNSLQLKDQWWGTSLVAQCLRIRLPMQGTRVRALVREDPTCHGATKPVRHNYWACALGHEPQLPSPWDTTTEAHAPRARALQQEKPPQWEAREPQRRVAPAPCN